MEIKAHNSYYEIDYEINFWRTKSGLEVDFILGGGEIAIEVKGAGRSEETYAPRKALVVCNEKEERLVGPVRITPWRKFLRDLWNGKIIS